ncbi:MAG TPA: DUF2203 domain-containing protein [bacterium]|nr:DUF2203 domain-containing protein [bacterium]
MTAQERLYTPASANRALPLVRSIVDDILARAREVRSLTALSRDPATDPEVAAQWKDIRDLVEELAGLGVEFKDPSLEIGLVDFPGEIDGEPVHLCWRRDEETVTHYHGRDEGFASRKPIPGELLGEG